MLINFISFLISPKSQESKQQISLKSSALPLFTGVLFGIVNALNLFLVGVMPSVVFFPLSNGGLLIATMLAAVVIFKEKLNGKQWMGIFVGLISMCMLGI